MKVNMKVNCFGNKVSSLHCKIVLLDDQQLVHEVSVSAKSDSHLLGVRKLGFVSRRTPKTCLFLGKITTSVFDRNEHFLCASRHFFHAPRSRCAASFYLGIHRLCDARTTFSPSSAREYKRYVHCRTSHCCYALRDCAHEAPAVVSPFVLGQRTTERGFAAAAIYGRLVSSLTGAQFCFGPDATGEG